MKNTGSIALLALLTAAQPAAAQSCIEQARAVAARIQEEVAPNLDRAQLARVAAISAELCSGRQGPGAPAAERAGAGEKAGEVDWFHYFLFRHSGDKPGNKRLKGLK